MLICGGEEGLIYASHDDLCVVPRPLEAERVEAGYETGPRELVRAQLVGLGSPEDGHGKCGAFQDQPASLERGVLRGAAGHGDGSPRLEAIGPCEDNLRQLRGLWLPHHLLRAPVRKRRAALRQSHV